VRTAIAAAKNINAQVNRLGSWEAELQRSIEDRLLYQNVINIDVFCGKKWISSDFRKVKRFRWGGSLIFKFSPEKTPLVEIHKVRSNYFLKITGNKDVWINGSHVADWQQVNHGDTILVGDHSLVVDILPLRRSFVRDRGVERVAGGENGEIVVEHGALLSYRAGRTHNEDAVAHAWINEDEELFVVGDGMGGHAAGEIASLRLMETMVPELRKGKGLPGAIERASDVIYQESQSDIRRRGMGTAMVAALINHKTNRVLMAWVGDSRGKYIPLDALQEAALLTRDHAMLWANDKLGIKPLAEKLPIEETRLEEIARVQDELEKDVMWKSFNHSITQVLGHPDKFKVHVVEIPYSPGPLCNILILYSDGLTGGLTEKWITELVRQGGTPEAIAKRLKDAALKLGTNDNVSVAVIPMPALDLAHLSEQIFGNNK
jgi:protein phosphatase